MSGGGEIGEAAADLEGIRHLAAEIIDEDGHLLVREGLVEHLGGAQGRAGIADKGVGHGALAAGRAEEMRSEEHTSELQSLMRISYAVFCLKKKKKHTRDQY